MQDSDLPKFRLSDILFKPVWVALQSLPQGMSATLPPLQGDKTLELEPPMKTILLFSILLCAIAMPAIGELSDADLDKIRLLVNEELKPVKADIETLKTEVAYVRGKLDILDKYVIALIALIVIAVGAPQIVMAWRSRRDRTLEKQIEILTQEIETIKQQQIVNP